jgi:hypothetical protein
VELGGVQVLDLRLGGQSTSLCGPVGKARTSARANLSTCLSTPPVGVALEAVIPGHRSAPAPQQWHRQAATASGRNRSTEMIPVTTRTPG